MFMKKFKVIYFNICEKAQNISEYIYFLGSHVAFSLVVVDNLTNKEN